MAYEQFHSQKSFNWRGKFDFQFSELQIEMLMDIVIKTCSQKRKKKKMQYVYHKQNF